MEQTTILALAPLAPLAIGLAFAYIASHVRNVRTVPYTGLSAAEFDAAFTAWAEYRASEECYLAHKEEK
jgi:hypothetical protein